MYTILFHVLIILVILYTCVNIVYSIYISIVIYILYYYLYYMYLLFQVMNIFNRSDRLYMCIHLQKSHIIDLHNTLVNSRCRNKMFGHLLYIVYKYPCNEVDVDLTILLNS